MKKKKGVLVRTVLVLVGLVLTVAGFLFSQVESLASLYSNQADLFAPVTWNTLFDPMKNSFDILFKFDFTGYQYRQGTMYVVLGLGIIALIAVVVASIVKRTARYVGHLVLMLVADFVGLYLVCFVFERFALYGGINILHQVLRGAGGPFLELLKFKINIVAAILVYVMIVGALLVFVSTIALFIVVMHRICHAERKVKVVEEKTELPVKQEEPAKVEEKALAPEAKKTKKVVLVVKRYDAFKNNPEPVIERPTEYPRQQVEVKPLTKEDIRRALKEELDAREREEALRHPIVREVEKVEEKPNVKVSVADSVEENNEKPLIPTPIIISIPEPIKELNEEVKPETRKPALKKEDIREIVREELAKAIASLKAEEPEEEVVEEVKEVPVVVEKVVEVPKEVVKEEPKVEPQPVKEEPQVVDETVPAPKEEAVESAPEEVVTLEEANVVEAKKVETEAVQTVDESVEEPKAAPAKIERISFATRIKNADDDLKDAYNHIKSLLLSYGLKNRVSNGGDAFRLHKVNYCKITVAGNSLKLYLALDPADYKNSTLPIKDASSKAIYKDIPLVFKVKSGLSLRRAEQLITEMMDKHGLEQVDRVEVKDYVSNITTDVNEDESDDE